jgi:PIN domain nuclease of toxin-antitoxin system
LKLLLDTHIWIWSLAQPERLSRHVRKELADPINEFWLSPISLWEAFLLYQKGRIQLPSDLREWVPKAIDSFREAPLTHEIVAEARELPLSHQDPADRFLAATAKVLSLTLVTADYRLLGLKNISTLANR